jgi:hypothetical protein
LSERTIRDGYQALTKMKKTMEDSYDDFMKHIHETDFLVDDGKFMSKLWKCRSSSVTVVGAYEQGQQQPGGGAVVNPATGEVMQTGQHTLQPAHGGSGPTFEMNNWIFALIIGILIVVAYLTYTSYSDAESQIVQLQAVLVNATQTNNVVQATAIKGQIAQLSSSQSDALKLLGFVGVGLAAFMFLPKILEILARMAGKEEKPEKGYPPLREWIMSQFNQVAERYTSALFLVQMQDQNADSLPDTFSHNYPSDLIYDRRQFMITKLRSEFTTKIGQVFQVSEAILDQRMQALQLATVQITQAEMGQKGAG